MWGGCHSRMFPPRLRRAPVTDFRPSLLRCGERPCDDLRRFRKRRASPNIQPPCNTLNRDSLPAPTQNTQPPSSTLNRVASPPQFARHGAHALNHRDSPQNPAGFHAPEPQTRRGIDIPRRDIRVSGLCEDGSLTGAGEISTPSSQSFRGNARSRRFRRISGIFFEVRPLGLEPRTID